MRRNIDRHADGNAARAIDQQVGKLRRNDDRLALGIVIVVLEVDRVLVEIGQQFVRRLGQPRLGVAHGCSLVAVDRAEIALPVDQRHAQGEILRHAHQGVVDRRVAMRMVFTDHVTDDAGRFAVRLVPVIAVLVHRIENAPVHRLETVTRIRQGPADDHAHGVIEIGLAHFLDDRDRFDIRRTGWPLTTAVSRRIGYVGFVRQRHLPRLKFCHLSIRKRFESQIRRCFYSGFSVFISMLYAEARQYLKLIQAFAVTLPFVGRIAGCKSTADRADRALETGLAKCGRPVFISCPLLIYPIGVAARAGGIREGPCSISTSF